MTDRWQQIEKICQSALELGESRRQAFLEEACQGDEELRREVESLLKFDSRGDRFIEQPALEMAAKMIAQEKPESLLGQQLGSYQILSLLGTGGMGVVYKARDTRLKRSVAIKVLPADQVSDPERKRRFIQEARAASALNHPNIITIYDVGSEGGIDFVVMEYVAGKPLDQMIPRKGMRLNETLKLAIQMADALAKAHSAGIIHRDLKPTNVMVTDDRLVKVLDFGLAKLTEVESDEGATRTTQLQTEEGTIVGTVSYMSPEQAEGKKVDARSDIFSFGAVLYEMVTGQKAFQGDSKMSTLMAVLQQESKPINQLVPGTPRDLEKIINRSLRKDLGQRFQHMDDLKVELEELKRESNSGTLPGAAPARPTRRSWVWAAAAIAVVAITVASWFFRGTARNPAVAPEVVPLTSYLGLERSPSFSRDGNQVAFSWDGEKKDNVDIYVKLIGSATPLQLTTNPAEDVSPAFSPDGRSIGFVRVSKDRATFIVIPAIGGPEQVVADINAPYLANSVAPCFAWFPDGKWVVIDGLALLSAESGEKRSLTSPPNSQADFSPAVSPDGRGVAFSRTASFGVSDIYLLELTANLGPTRGPRRLTSLKSFCFGPTWVPNGREIVFASSCVRFLGSGMRLWKTEASGGKEPEQLPFTGGDVCWPTFSGQGNRMAYQRCIFDSNIWRVSLSSPGVATGRPVRFIHSTHLDENPQYSADGKRISFESARSGMYCIWVSDADSSNTVELISRAGAPCGSAQWSPDGQRVAFDFSPDGMFDIYVMRASRGKPIRLTTDPTNASSPTWSRDGKWVYFGSERTGRSEVWKVSAEGGEAFQVTRNGGETAFESPDGQSLYYTKSYFSSGLWKMPVSGGEERQVLPSVVRRAFSLVKDGIYFIPEPDNDGMSSIQFLSFAAGKVQKVTAISGSPTEGLSVSPDGRFLLFSQLDEASSDLMLVEHFR